MASSNYNSYVISRTKKLQELLTKQAEEIVEQVAQDTVKKLKVFLNQYWYSRYSPKDYNRTYSLIDAIDYYRDGTSATIYIDDTKLVHDFRIKNWNAHMSFDGEDFGEELMYLIEDGIYPSGRYGSLKNPRAGHGVGVIQKTINWLNKYLPEQVKRQLSISFPDSSIY